MFNALHAALDTEDLDGFRRAAHSIKSNAEVFGAYTLAAPARALELMEVSGRTPEMQALIKGLETEFSRASNALKGLQNG